MTKPFDTTAFGTLVAADEHQSERFFYSRDLALAGARATEHRSILISLILASEIPTMARKPRTSMAKPSPAMGQSLLHGCFAVTDSLDAPPAVGSSGTGDLMAGSAAATPLHLTFTRIG